MVPVAYGTWMGIHNPEPKQDPFGRKLSPLQHERHSLFHFLDNGRTWQAQIMLNVMALSLRRQQGNSTGA